MRRFPLAPLSERQQELLGGGGRQVNRVVRIQRSRQAGAGTASPGSVSAGASARVQRRLEQARGRLRVALARPAVDLGDCLAALDLDLDLA